MQKYVNGQLVDMGQSEIDAFLAQQAIDATPPVVDINALDTNTINQILIQDGSVVRGLAYLVFGLMKGTITVNPSLTKAQFITALKAQMR